MLRKRVPPDVHLLVFFQHATLMYSPVTFLHFLLKSPYKPVGDPVLPMANFNVRRRDVSRARARVHARREPARTSSQKHTGGERRLQSPTGL